MYRFTSVTETRRNIVLDKVRFYYASLGDMASRQSAEPIKEELYNFALLKYMTLAAIVFEQSFVFEQDVMVKESMSAIEEVLRVKTAHVPQAQVDASVRLFMEEVDKEYDELVRKLSRSERREDAWRIVSLWGDPEFIFSSPSGPPAVRIARTNAEFGDFSLIKDYLKDIARGD